MGESCGADGELGDSLGWLLSSWEWGRLASVCFSLDARQFGGYSSVCVGKGRSLCRFAQPANRLGSLTSGLIWG